MMTREEFIKGDEYITVATEVFVVSGKRITEMRKDLHKFFIELRNELLECENKKILYLQDQIQRYRNELDWESSEKKSRIENETADTSNEL